MWIKVSLIFTLVICSNGNSIPHSSSTEAQSYPQLLGALVDLLFQKEQRVKFQDFKNQFNTIHGNLKDMAAAGIYD